MNFEKYSHATGYNREILFDACLLENSKCFNKVNIPAAILKLGEEKHRREGHDPSATQQQGQEENHPERQ